MTQSRGVMEIAYAESLKSAITMPQDAAIIALGRRLSRLIDVARGEEDEAASVIKLAAELRLVLTSLGMTPAARAAITGKTGPAANLPPASPLDELKGRRAARQG